MPQALFYTLAYFLFFAINGRISAYLHRLPGQNAVLLPLINQLYRLFYNHSLGCITAEQLAHRFYGVGMDLDG
jgi:hypothetical protein